MPPSLWNVLNEISQDKKIVKSLLTKKEKISETKSNMRRQRNNVLRILSVVAERNFFLFIKLKFWKTVIEQANTRYIGIYHKIMILYIGKVILWLRYR